MQYSIRSVLNETKALIKLGGPIVVAQVAQTAMGFVDTVMAGRVSSIDLAAVAVGTSIWIPVYLTISSILLATTPSVAQFYGARRHHEIGPFVRQAIWLSLLLGLIGFYLLRHTQPLLLFMNVSPDIQVLTLKYLDGLSWGMPAIAVYQVLRNFSGGLSHTRPAMVIGFMALAINVPLNYIFIYGEFGMPVMGGAGCGWATGVVMWAMLLIMLIYTIVSCEYKGCDLYKSWQKPNVKVINEILKLGLPIGCSVFMEVSIFCVIALLISSLGAAVVAGHQIVLNFASLVFMIPLSISSAITVRVGQAVGSKNFSAAKLSSLVGTGLAMMLAMISATWMLTLPESIAAIYTNDVQAQAVAVSLIFYAAAFQLADGIHITAVGALRGYKDTRVPMFITLVAFWLVGLPVGYGLGFTNIFGEALGPQGLWVGLVAALTVAAVLQFIRVKHITNHHISSHRITDLSLRACYGVSPMRDPDCSVSG